MYNFLSIAFFIFNIKNFFAYETVDIDLQYYKGVWYQTYGDNFELTTLNVMHIVYMRITRLLLIIHFLF